MRSGRRRGGALTRTLFLWMAVIGFVLGAGPMQTAEAHFTSTGYTDISMTETELHYGLFLTEHDLLQTLPVDQNKDEQLSNEELEAARAELEKFISSSLIVTGDGKVGRGVLKQAQKTTRAKSQMIGMDIVYSFAKPVQRYQIQYQLFYDGMNSEHRSYATIRLGDRTIEQVLNRNNNILQIQGIADSTAGNGAEQGEAAASQSWLQTLRSYIWMGMTHIWSGIDHMLFLLLIVLATREKWALLHNVTAFTIGHSITLVLSALDLASVSPRVVEPLIALSIVYMAAETIFRKSERNYAAVTMGFGFIHGFGFAEIIKGTLSGHVALPLFSFNLGVELGQIAVLLVLLPILWGMRRQLKPIWWHSASGVVGVFGVYWFIERIIGS
ncbi:HupE/UreJ family protein [Paenibacillus sp. NPDC056579]|uniref:HupE/UreJ family protein n=1 Tax=Paenibacillus sp. NPDC056579 TaxID=3345871 RepID=UPI0036C7CEDA